MESILTSVKRLCGGISEDNTGFDDELVIYINSVFFNLWQMGIGPDKVFKIEDNSTEWAEFLPVDDNMHETCKLYVGSKARLRFDPPTNSSTMQALKETIAECEWRLSIVEP